MERSIDQFSLRQLPWSKKCNKWPIDFSLKHFICPVSERIWKNRNPNKINVSTRTLVVAPQNVSV